MEDVIGHENTGMRNSPAVPDAGDLQEKQTGKRERKRRQAKPVVRRLELVCEVEETHISSGT